MPQKIRAVFQDEEIARLARDALQHNGYDQIRLYPEQNRYHVELDVHNGEQIAAYEILNSYGARLATNTYDNPEDNFPPAYQALEFIPVQMDGDTSHSDYPLDDREWGAEDVAPRSLYERNGAIEGDLVDQNAIIDPNIGYGDYELIEPYVLDSYEKMMEENSEES
ncbi:MAG: hypothetical protein H0Z33_01810 [Bacillaceae bacterium]|nr:hypothetical protein [Bacillaceae bacterium]